LTTNIDSGKLLDALNALEITANTGKFGGKPVVPGALNALSRR